jgi:hypothetical protein
MLFFEHRTPNTTLSQKVMQDITCLSPPVCFAPKTASGHAMTLPASECITLFRSNRAVVDVPLKQQHCQSMFFVLLS